MIWSIKLVLSLGIEVGAFNIERPIFSKNWLLKHYGRAEFLIEGSRFLYPKPIYTLITYTNEISEQILKEKVRRMGEGMNTYVGSIADKFAD
ncbi:hypothetical protein HKD37_20G055230 [Glycine soja]